MRGPLRVLRRGLVLALAVAGLQACELEEITIVEVEPVVVAEVYVNLAEDPADNDVRALLHWTVGADLTGRRPLTESRLILRRTDGLVVPLFGAQLEECVGTTAPDEVGACFVADPGDALALAPGDFLELDVLLPDGGRLFGSTRTPSSFALDEIPVTCRLTPDTRMTVRWSRSEGAWAYLNETSIRNLPDALRPEGIIAREDPLYLLGLSVSDQDTTIVFPSEFGVFNRFDLDQDVAVRLQSGLPATTLAEVTITAVERNYENWARGGNFNPSGQVRVPSLRGDGTGVFASTVARRFVIVVEPPGGVLADCPGLPTP